ncbi:MAG: phosphotransferase family protein [Candidatus Heimdallarchaeota archaeon]
MSTISLKDLKQDQLKNHLKVVLEAKTISDFIVHPSAVNTTLQFEANKKKYIIKLMTTPTTDECEKYRFDKVGKLFEQFVTNPKIPAPEVIRVENSEEPIGYRYLIMTFVGGENLRSIQHHLSKEEMIPIVKELANIVRSIHSIEFDYYGEIEECKEATKYYDYKEKMVEQITELTDAILESKILPKNLVKKANTVFLGTLENTKTYPTSTLLHNDIHQGNIIVKKDDKGEYKIQAILDWEWACADNPLEDIVYIESGVLQDLEIRKIFYKEYYQGERDNLVDFVNDIKLFNILWTFDDVVHGWTFHNPTPENVENIKNNLERLLQSE